MNTESIYGLHLDAMEHVRDEIVQKIETYRSDVVARTGEDPVDHILSRIKSEESMREKCRRKHLPETTESALNVLHDAIGVRVVCPFRNDIYDIIRYVRSFEDCEVTEVKDYIKHAKPNGYRSYHMILRVRGGYYVEMQLRTVSMDTWAALEHQLKYKKDIINTDLIVAELKRCADELASTDASMQTIRDLINGEY